MDVSLINNGPVTIIIDSKIKINKNDYLWQTYLSSL